jgi:branched-chain amino acid aminotransferase
VLELPTASFFWVADGKVHTPPLSDHVLDSITRRIVIEVGAAKETVTTPADLESAEEAFVASSVREVIAVSRIEQGELPAPGAITSATAEKVSAYIQAELARQ